MDINKAYYSTGVIFEDKDGNKYALNPFATSENQKNMSDPLAPTKTDTDEFTLACSHCDLLFENDNEYEHHNIAMHGKRKLLTCNICTATFRRQDHLKRHTQSLHTNQKFCHCPVCGKDYKRQDILLKHIKKKHSSKPEIFRCRECEFECGTLTDLEKHEYSHLLTERHLCSHCNTSFKRRDHMLRHVKSQHLNQFVLCPICGQTYKRKDHVVRHVREKHKMGLLNGKLVKSSDII